MKVSLPLPISFEFFPPKTPEGMKDLIVAAHELSIFKPQFFSVTFGAGGSTRDGTLDTVKMIQQKTNVIAVPHLACIGFNREDILQTLGNYQAAGVRRIVALRGDLPSGMGNAGEFKYASELVQLTRETTADYFHVVVAAYPEIHPQAVSAKDDVQNLKRKYDAGANTAITQYFFNPDAYFYYVDECAKAGIDMPIIPGIMPIMQYSKLARFSDMCGAEIPRWIRKRLESYGDDLESVREFGAEVVYNLCQSLIAGGVPGLHFYTLNKSDVCLKVLGNINVSVGQTNEKRNMAS